ncbi:hypothetical protein DPMN_025465 [Dreissena polymorpha]|uniref:Uncharacterized protein n=1 Tax=Dreissena polymorpha TaxID=45954 RepID=A0A9D4RCK6_DREPO|nr:hypothetical protein DPMN_025465 [Dreissena polymorpha]
MVIHTARLPKHVKLVFVVAGWAGIGYSIVVDKDGNVYEARGWNEIGAHTYGYNSVGLGLFF